MSSFSPKSVRVLFAFYPLRPQTHQIDQLLLSNVLAQHQPPLAREVEGDRAGRGHLAPRLLEAGPD